MTLEDTTNNARNTIETYRSKNRILPEALNPDVFTIDDSVASRISECDNNFVKELEERISKEGIPYEGTYFIINIGHAHLVGVAEYLMRQGVEPYFMIPGLAQPRIKEALRFWEKAYCHAKENLGKPRGLATLIDCHRDTAEGSNFDIEPNCQGYRLLPAALPSASELRNLSIKKVIYLGETTITKIDKPYGVFHTEDLKQRIENYEAEGIKIEQYGIDPRKEEIAFPSVGSPNFGLFLGQLTILNMIKNYSTNVGIKLKGESQ